MCTTITTEPLLRRWPLRAKRLVYAVNSAFQFSCFTQVHSARDEVEEGQRGLFMVQAGRAARAAPSFATS